MKRLGVLAAVVLVVLMVHASRGSAVGVSPLVSCIPNCAGVEDFTWVADPMNCTNYYVCLDEQPLSPPSHCESGYFEDGTCMGATCEQICGEGASCPLTCNSTLKAVGDAFDCSVYYYCLVDGPSEPQGCNEPNPYFDPNTFLCVDDPTVCCTGYCKQYCDGSGNEMVADPNNCLGFCLCFENQEGEASNCYNCGSGEYFNVQVGDCVPGTPPQPCKLCDAMPGGSTAAGGDTTTTGSGGNTDGNGCVSSLVCPGEGDYAACNTCQRVYFKCTGAGTSGVVNYCPIDYLFNPETRKCVFENECLL